jgi:hypothetical protein
MTRLQMLLHPGSKRPNLDALHELHEQRELVGLDLVGEHKVPGDSLEQLVRSPTSPSLGSQFPLSVLQRFALRIVAHSPTLYALVLYSFQPFLAFHSPLVLWLVPLSDSSQLSLETCWLFKTLAIDNLLALKTITHDNYRLFRSPLDLLTTISLEVV